MRQLALRLLVATCSTVAISTACTDDYVEIPYAAITDVRETDDGRLLVAGYSSPCQCQSPSGFIEFLDTNDDLEDFASRLRAAKIPTDTSLPPVWGVTECAAGDFVGVTGDWPPYTIATGPKWTSTQLSEDWILVGIAGTACDDLVAVGRLTQDGDTEEVGAIVTFDGDAWSAAEIPEGTPPLSAIWRGELGTFAVGEEGTVLSFDGETWVAMDTPTDIKLRDVWGTSERAYAVGGVSDGQYVIIEYFEDTWTIVAEGDGTLLGIDGRAADDIYAVGGRADAASGSPRCTVLHFDGSQWAAVDCKRAAYLWSVTAMSDGRIIAGGPDSTLMDVGP